MTSLMCLLQFPSTCQHGLKIDGSKMPYLKIFYGPYEAHGIIRHKHQRLHGFTCMF